MLAWVDPLQMAGTGCSAGDRVCPNVQPPQARCDCRGALERQRPVRLARKSVAHPFQIGHHVVNHHKIAEDRVPRTVFGTRFIGHKLAQAVRLLKATDNRADV